MRRRVPGINAEQRNRLLLGDLQGPQHRHQVRGEEAFLLFSVSSSSSFSLFSHFLFSSPPPPSPPRKTKATAGAAETSATACDAKRESACSVRCDVGEKREKERGQQRKKVRLFSHASEQLYPPDSFFFQTTKTNAAELLHLRHLGRQGHLGI